ncbi:16606_t:CDS:10 [Funneliformis mosseae]|uniref:16606_t:CDS:1 n=1 Tax=Funneliformis mosseae TaxID=27381 RepID=A0A9N9F235_FUNMO|nr:16606_t:CDS:10 [Funneliformis mosseae]
MGPRRSARIAALTDNNKKNESVEQSIVIPKRKVRSKKSVENVNMTSSTSIPTENISRSSKTIACEEVTEAIDVLITPAEPSINKGKSKESTLPLIDSSINKGKSKEIFQHSDGSKSFLEPIDSSWLQKRKFGQSHDNDNDSCNNGTIEHSLQSNNVNEEDDSDDWEEVDLSEYQDLSDNLSESRPFPNKTIQLTFKMPKIQYKYCAMAFSLIEYELQALFDKALVKIDVKHANLLTIALQDLCKWWKNYFTITKPGIRNREYHEFGEDGVENIIEKDEFSDCLPSIDAFRKSLRVGEGSRDTSTQLFVAALRSLGIPARLVCSLQAVSFRFARKNKTAASRNRKEGNGSNNENLMNNNINEEVQRTLGLGKYKLNANRKNSKDVRVGHSKKQRSVSKKGRKQDDLQKSDVPPIFWCEVYFAAYKKWICVDPVRALVNSPQAMEPASNVTDNIMAYVVAYEKDVTRRYATQWGARTRKLRVPVTKDGYDWWHETLVYFARPYESKQDDEEDAHLHKLEVSERIPTSIGPFNNHPLYALERHLKKYEIIHPKQPIIGHIRDEPIYPRRNVKQLHTAETWLREGRQVKIGEQPVKHVKSRIYTVSKRRAANMASLYDEDPPESGLYGEWQTEEYIPEPIINGKIPKNSYGNVNMFKECMCPIGGVHIPINGIGKVAKDLGIDYGDAVVGFDFQARRCIPVVHGIVVAKENEIMLLEAWHEHASVVEAKNNAKREKAVLARWRKFIIGIKIRMRLQNDYVKHDWSDMEEEESEFHHGESEGESELYHGDTDEEDNNNSIGVDDKGETNESIVDKVVINNNDFSDYMDIESEFICEDKVEVNTGDDFMNEENDREGGFIHEENDTDEVFMLE